MAVSDRLDHEVPGSRSRQSDGLLVLTQVYEPEPNFITGDVARFFARRMPVTVVTGHPNYPYGRFYPGTRYWRVTRSEEDGVVVWRVPYFPDHSLSRWRRALSYLSFALMAAVVAPFVARHPRTVWVYHGPFATGLAAVWFKAVRKSRLVVTCADLWPECFTPTGVAVPQLLMRAAYAYRRWFNSLADAVICCTRGTVKRLRSDGEPESKLRYIPVWLTEHEALQVDTAHNDEHRIVYAGNLGPTQQLETLIDASAELKRQGVPVSLHIYGTGTREAALKERARAAGATTIFFHGRVSPQEAVEASRNSWAQVVILRKSELLHFTVPSKLYSCFAAASPLLYGLEGESAELAAASGGGIPFDSSSPESFAAAVIELMRKSPAEHYRMRQHLRTYYEQHFAPHRLLEQYAEVLGDATTGAEAGRE